MVSTLLHFVPRLLCVAALGTVALSSATGAELTTLSGRRLSGEFVSIDGQAVLFKPDGTTSAPLRVPVLELAQIELRKAPIETTGVPWDELELTDGSTVRLTRLLIKGKRVEATLLTQAEGAVPPTLEMPVGTVSSYLRNAGDSVARQEWKKLLAGRGKRDLFVIRQADGLNTLPGTVLDGNEAGDAVAFERQDGQKVNLKLSRATGGIAFNQPQRDILPPTLCRVADAFGNVWVATKIEVEGPSLRVVTVSGAVALYTSREAVVKLDFSLGNVTFLSDMEATADYAPPEKDGLLGEQYPLQRRLARDRSLASAEILLDGKKYIKGLSIPPDAVVSYKLDGGYREFKATLGIQDGANRESWRVKLRVEVDGRTVFNEALPKSAKPRDLVLNVKDAKELKISVERDGLYAGDQLNLADARVQK